MIARALNKLRPNSKWMMNGDDFSTIEWHPDNQDACPSFDEVQAEIARLEAEYKANEYQRLRAAEYPSIVDQLDTLYHGGYDAWKATIQAVKDKYPKE